MRPAKKLGFLGLFAALVAVLGLVGGRAASTWAQAVTGGVTTLPGETETCVGPAAQTTTAACFFTLGASVPTGGDITMTIQTPGVTFQGVSLGAPPTGGIVATCTGGVGGPGTQTWTLTGCGALPAGQQVGVNFNVPLTFNNPNSEVITMLVTYNNIITGGGIGGTNGVCQPGATAGAFSCTVSFNPAVVIPAGVGNSQTFTLTISPAAGQSISAIAAAAGGLPAGCAITSQTPVGGLGPGAPVQLTITCTNASATTNLLVAGFTFAVTVTGGTPAITVGPTGCAELGGPGTACVATQVITFTSGIPTGLCGTGVGTFSTNGCVPCVPIGVGATNLPVVNNNCTIFTADPVAEVKTCGPNVLLGGITGETPSLGTVTGTTFTLPLFNNEVPTTCAVILCHSGPALRTEVQGVCPAGTLQCVTGTLTPGTLPTPANAGTPVCADGVVNVQTITGGVNPVPGNGGILVCDGQSINPPSSGNSCNVANGGQSLDLYCGNTAGNNLANAGFPIVGGVPTGTCGIVFFNIQSAISNCLVQPVTGCGALSAGGLGINFGNLGGSISVDVSWIAQGSTAYCSGCEGGVKLGTNTFNFQGPGIGTLLVTASPELIPSNGTSASVITATFACGNSYQVTSLGFPLSAFFSGGATGTSTASTIVANQPILGTGQSAVCGAGLAGTFTFASPGPVLFDNGRPEETVSCGAPVQDNFFSGLGLFGNGYNPTAPLIFTCTGAAVLAIGAGAAGDAPINVTYQSALGGLQAIGSTMLEIAPSGVPRISIACNPNTIAGGNTGSLCTATVTDQNGVPLSGVTGATVTFTVSDPTEATILPCVVQVFGTLNVTTSPNVIPQIVPNTPCLTPSSTIPGQENTFINGQATALLVASSYARPETVTVTASLGVLVPPEFACLVSPYTPTSFGTAINGTPAISGVGLPGLSGCGFSNPVGLTGLASALSTDSGGLTGIVTLPNTTSASTTVNIGGPTGILIAGATPTQPLQLTRGCNQVVVTSVPGTPIANIAALVSPASAVVSIWRFNNGTKQFQAGFFSDPAAPTDFIATGLPAATGPAATGILTTPSFGTQVTETYFVCVNQAAAIVSG